MVVKYIILSIILFYSSFVYSKSMIDMTDTNARENSLLIKIQEDILTSSYSLNKIGIKEGILKWRSQLIMHCVDLNSEGSSKFFEQYSCMNKYERQLILVLNDRLKLFSSECLLASSNSEKQLFHKILGQVVCTKGDIVCLDNVEKRLSINLSTVDSSEHCLPSWLTKLKSKYFYKIIKKSYLHKTPNKTTKMYLVKGDKITILDEQTDSSGQKWYFINYKGKKDLNMWIKAEAVDLAPKTTEPNPTEKTTPKEPAPQTS